jgi:hypothetical protein
MRGEGDWMAKRAAMVEEVRPVNWRYGYATKEQMNGRRKARK